MLDFRECCNRRSEVDLSKCQQSIKYDILTRVYFCHRKSHTQLIFEKFELNVVEFVIPIKALNTAKKHKSHNGSHSFDWNDPKLMKRIKHKKIAMKSVSSATKQAYCNRLHCRVCGNSTCLLYKTAKKGKIWHYCFSITTMQLSFNAFIAVAIIVVTTFLSWTLLFFGLLLLRIYCGVWMIILRKKPRKKNKIASGPQK